MAWEHTLQALKREQAHHEEKRTFAPSYLKGKVWREGALLLICALVLPVFHVHHQLYLLFTI